MITNSKIQLLLDKLLTDYENKDINTQQINDVRKIVDQKIKSGLAQIKYQKLNSNTKIDFFDDGK